MSPPATASPSTMALGTSLSGAKLAVTFTVKNAGKNSANAAANPARYALHDFGAPPVCVSKLIDAPYNAQKAMTTLIRCQVNPCRQRATNWRTSIGSEERRADAIATSAASIGWGGAEL